MSKEYIEKEATINYLTLNMCWYDEEGGQVEDWDERKAIISDLLDDIPPADVKPVVRGEWKCTDDMFELAVCSVCGWETDEPFGYIVEKYHSCPNCGAEMREEEK